MRIVHISDLHWRCQRYHDEYRRSFEDLFRKIDELQPDFVVDTGDSVHQKLQMSPELVSHLSWMFRELSRRAQVIVIPGNHDMSLVNKSRMDVLTPVLEALDDPNIYYLKSSGPFRQPFWPATFWSFSLADRDRWPVPDDWNRQSDQLNIGLFHGSVSGCVTDIGWQMDEAEHNLSMFDGLDYVLLGDIHKRQLFRGGR